MTLDLLTRGGPTLRQNRSVTSKELVRLLESHGWSKARHRGSHATYTNPMYNGIILTVPLHAGDLPKGTLNQILKRAGLKP